MSMIFVFVVCFAFLCCSCLFLFCVFSCFRIVSVFRVFRFPLCSVFRCSCLDVRRAVLFLFRVPVSVVSFFVCSIVPLFVFRFSLFELSLGRFSLSVC